MAMVPLKITGRFLCLLYLEVGEAITSRIDDWRLVTNNGESFVILPDQRGPNGELVALLDESATHGEVRLVQIVDRKARALTDACRYRFPTKSRIEEAGGFVDSVLVTGESITITGWVAYWYELTRRAGISVWINGRLAGIARANEYRADLKGIGIGDGCYGYTVRIYCGEITQPLTVEVKSDEQLLRNGLWSISLDGLAAASQSSPVAELRGLLPLPVVNFMEDVTKRLELASSSLASGRSSAPVELVIEGVERLIALLKGMSSSGPFEEFLFDDLVDLTGIRVSILAWPILEDQAADHGYRSLKGVLEAGMFDVIVLRDVHCLVPPRLVRSLASLVVEFGPDVVGSIRTSSAISEPELNAQSDVWIGWPNEDPSVIALPYNTFLGLLHERDTAGINSVSDVANFCLLKQFKALVACSVDWKRGISGRFLADHRRGFRSWKTAVLRLGELTDFCRLNASAACLIIERQVVALVSNGYRVEIEMEKGIFEAFGVRLKRRGFVVHGASDGSGSDSRGRGIFRKPDCVFILRFDGGDYFDLAMDENGSVGFPVFSLFHPLCVPILGENSSDSICAMESLGFIPSRAWPVSQVTVCQLSCDDAAESDDFDRLLGPSLLAPVVVVSEANVCSAAVLIVEKGGIVVSSDPVVVSLLARIGFSPDLLRSKIKKANLERLSQQQRLTLSANLSVDALVRLVREKVNSTELQF